MPAQKYIAKRRLRILLSSLSALSFAAAQMSVMVLAEETSTAMAQTDAGTTVWTPGDGDIPDAAPTRICRPGATPGDALAPVAPFSSKPQTDAKSARTRATAKQDASKAAKSTNPLKPVTPATKSSPAAKQNTAKAPSSSQPKLMSETAKMAPPPTATTGSDDRATPPTTANGGGEPASSNGSSQSQTASEGSAATKDTYPTIGKLEVLTFGSAAPNVKIEDRLAKLETAVMKKSYPEESLFDRTERLKHILVGASDEGEGVDLTQLLPSPPSQGSDSLMMDSTRGTSSSSGGPMVERFDNLASAPENQNETTKEEAQQYFVALVNDERQKIGLEPLQVDGIAAKVAIDQLNDMRERNVISHSNSKGQNPDRRYTLQGGDGAVTESLVSVGKNETNSSKITRAAVCKMLKSQVLRQDDREALFAAEATNIGVGIDFNKMQDKVLGVVEVVTKHGTVDHLATDLPVGEKVNISGEITPPFRFEKITLAWEGDHALGSTSDESQEALPYFPPLDYVAYQHKSDKDMSGTVNVLKTVGVVAAIAGGVFMPPVALAAPLILMAGSSGSGEPKPVSDIPVHGGVKVANGSAFNARVPINNSGKEGIYYITVWASLGQGTKVVPVSRRAVMGTAASESVAAKVEKGE